MTREILLTQDKVAIVDNKDYERVAEYKWYAHCSRGRWYASAKDVGFMHRFILQTPYNQGTDHINGDGLDNRRCNLRIATSAQNSMNRRKRTSISSSQYKGVTWFRNKWLAQIWVNERNVRLGYFSNEEDAARAYDEAAKKAFGEFARLNFG